MNQREKADRYDYIDACIFQDECPKCKQHTEWTLAQFHHLNLSKGLIYTCPFCNAEFCIKTIELEELEK